MASRGCNLDGSIVFSQSGTTRAPLDTWMPLDATIFTDINSYAVFLSPPLYADGQEQENFVVGETAYGQMIKLRLRSPTDAECSGTAMGEPSPSDSFELSNRTVDSLWERDVNWILLRTGVHTALGGNFFVVDRQPFRLSSGEVDFQVTFPRGNWTGFSKEPTVMMSLSVLHTIDYKPHLVTWEITKIAWDHFNVKLTPFEPSAQFEYIGQINYVAASIEGRGSLTIWDYTQDSAAHQVTVDTQMFVSDDVDVIRSTPLASFDSHTFTSLKSSVSRYPTVVREADGYPDGYNFRLDSPPETCTGDDSQKTGGEVSFFQFSMVSDVRYFLTTSFPTLFRRMFCDGWRLNMSPHLAAAFNAFDIRLTGLADQQPLIVSGSDKNITIIELGSAANATTPQEGIPKSAGRPLQIFILEDALTSIEILLEKQQVFVLANGLNLYSAPQDFMPGRDELQVTFDTDCAVMLILMSPELCHNGVSPENAVIPYSADETEKMHKTRNDKTNSKDKPEKADASGSYSFSENVTDSQCNMMELESAMLCDIYDSSIGKQSCLSVGCCYEDSTSLCLLPQVTDSACAEYIYVPFGRQTDKDDDYCSTYVCSVASFNCGEGSFARNRNCAQIVMNQHQCFSPSDLTSTDSPDLPPTELTPTHLESSDSTEDWSSNSDTSNETAKAGGLRDNPEFIVGLAALGALVLASIGGFLSITASIMGVSVGGVLSGLGAADGGAGGGGCGAAAGVGGGKGLGETENTPGGDAALATVGGDVEVGFGEDVTTGTVDPITNGTAVVNGGGTGTELTGVVGAGGTEVGGEVAEVSSSGVNPGVVAGVALGLGGAAVALPVAVKWNKIAKPIERSAIVEECEGFQDEVLVLEDECEHPNQANQLYTIGSLAPEQTSSEWADYVDASMVSLASRSASSLGSSSGQSSGIGVGLSRRAQTIDDLTVPHPHHRHSHQHARENTSPRMNHSQPHPVESTPHHRHLARRITTHEEVMPRIAETDPSQSWSNNGEMI
eukprot:GHVN01068967.1.p1 GENE.GHVN01068967.1~~GHVN01068967.1.p1  ORF type:complete len:1008 (-),score=142.15 GHVN01068967.1:4147-7170(-)